jgi:hypothetical protein
MTAQPTCSINRTNRITFIGVDLKRARTWSVDKISKLAICTTGIIMLCASVPPLFTSVHGQPKTPLEWEVQDLRKNYESLRPLVDANQTAIALFAAHERLEDQWHAEEVGFRWKLLEAILSAGGAIFIALLGWFLHESGIVIGRKRESA